MTQLNDVSPRAPVWNLWSGGENCPLVLTFRHFSFKPAHPSVTDCWKTADFIQRQTRSLAAPATTAHFLAYFNRTGECQHGAEGSTESNHTLLFSPSFCISISLYCNAGGGFFPPLCGMKCKRPLREACLKASIFAFLSLPLPLFKGKQRIWGGF